VLSLIAAGVAGWSPLTCPAAVIGLQVESRTEISNEVPAVSIRVTNTGDESARAVQVEARLGDFTATTPTQEALAAAESHDFVLPLGEMPGTPGAYPVLIKVRYTDANGYPFTALSAVTLSAAAPDPAPLLTLGMLPVDMISEAPMSMVLRTLAGDETDARVRLFVPDEIRCSPPDARRTLRSGEICTLDFRLSNVAAQPNSRYPVFGIVEWEKEGRHHAVIRSAVVSVTAPEPLFRRYRWAGIGAVAVLLVVFAAVQFIGIAGRRRR
jgi:hypothetical protein